MNNIQVIESAAISNYPVEVIERKGWGHPDKIADDLAEELSRAYSRYTLANCGAILHHNFDKLCILGGKSQITFGSGTILKPIRVLVNGRVSKSFAGKDLAIEQFIETTCINFMETRLPALKNHNLIQVILNLSSSSSPGFIESGSSDNVRENWFSPRSVKDLPEIKYLFANDTSIGSSYAPLSKAEKCVLDLSNYLSSPSRTMPDWMGTDIKIMAEFKENKTRIIACVPQICTHVNNIKQYQENLEWVRKDISSFLSRYSIDNFDLFLNTRDKIENHELYLTYTGSSIESGDEGVVGRGNRINGLITPMKPMNIEGVNGKNPVYHVGKLYNYISNIVAQKIYKTLGVYNEVFMVSQSGYALNSPWSINVKVEKSVNVSKIEEIINSELSKLKLHTEKIINSSIEELPFC